MHFRYTIDADVDDLQIQAFEEGVRLWNNSSKTTKFVFEKATTAPGDFRLQRGLHGLDDQETTEKNSCTGFALPTSFIWYSPEAMGWVTKANVIAAGRIYAHELGHALHLADNDNITSIMRRGDSNVPCQERAASPLLAIPDEDLWAAYACGHCARAKGLAKRMIEKPSPARQP